MDGLQAETSSLGNDRAIAGEDDEGGQPGDALRLSPSVKDGPLVAPHDPEPLVSRVQFI